MSFSEGFTNGFNMVDTAMQRRKAIELDQAQQARTEDHYQAGLKRQGALDQQTIDWRKEDQGLAATTTAYNQGQDAIKNASTEKELNAKIADDKSARRLQAQSNSIQASQANTQAAHYNILNQASQAQLAATNYELRTKQAEDAKNAAMPILDAMQTTDPKTGNVSLAWSSNPATFKQQLTAAHDVTHIDYEKLYNNPDTFTKHIQTIKTGLADRNHWDKNKSGVLDSLNTTMKSDIEAGKVGQKYDGLDSNLKDGIIKSIKINDAFPSPDGTGLIAGVQTTYQMPDGSIKSDHGPMTDLRTSNPDEDPNVKVIPLSEIVGKVDTIDQLAQSIKNDPEHTKLIQSYIKASKKKPEGGTKSVIYKDNYDSNTGVNTKTPDSIFDNQSGEMKPINNQPNNQSNIATRTANAQAILNDPNATTAQKQLAETYLKQ